MSKNMDVSKRKQSIIAGGLISSAGIFLQNSLDCSMQSLIIPCWEQRTIWPITE